MTASVALVLLILLGAVVLFVSGWIRMDLTALLVLGALALTGLVTPAQALSGFSNPAVITVGGMFVISAALARTGVANLLGRQVLRMAGEGEMRLIVVIMSTAGVLSAVMNNIGVAAMMLPVVMDIARRIGRPPSRLLMPLALGTLLGGLLTLIGTPPNILVSDALRAQGLPPFRLFEFTPIGVVILVVGIAFIALVGRHLLPVRDPRREAQGSSERDLVQSYELQERFFIIRLPPRSLLEGKTLAESRLGSALGLHVLAILREHRPKLAPGPDALLHSGDRLLVQGRPDLLVELRGRRHLEMEEDANVAERLVSAEIGVAEARLEAGSGLVGRTLHQAELRNRYGILVLALRRDGVPRRTALEDVPLQAGDTLLLQGAYERLEALTQAPEFGSVNPLTVQEGLAAYQLEERFVTLRVTDQSILVGRSLRESRLGDAAGLMVLGISRNGETRLIPVPDEVLQPDDLLLVKARPDTLVVLRGLQKLEIEPHDESVLSQLESDTVGLLEVVLAPRTNLVGRTPRQIGFRDKYGLSVLAIWREGRAFRSNLRDTPLRFGDSLLVFGPREKLKVLAREPDFLVLTEAMQEPPRTGLAPVSVLILSGVLLPVMLGWVSIAISVIVGATLMILTRCVTAEEAYRAVEWPAIVLIAGMLPLGIAMGETGAARLLADGVIGSIGTLGPRGVLAGICLMTALGAQVIPSAALVVLMAPIALSTAVDLGISPYTLMMGVALSAASLSSPVAHPANVLIMGPGGYRYGDYVRVGMPLTLLVLLIVIWVMPLFFPFFP
ncbi:MAG TPA: SLC13 family permease [Longimicrobiaceae bacterium]|nr:SLC13 family permease [Longimicrobiaceae bacterium]